MEVVHLDAGVLFCRYVSVDDGFPALRRFFCFFCFRTDKPLQTEPDRYMENISDASIMIDPLGMGGAALTRLDTFFSVKWQAFCLPLLFLPFVP